MNDLDALVVAITIFVSTYVLRWVVKRIQASEQPEMPYRYQATPKPVDSCAQGILGVHAHMHRGRDGCV
jgi:hypothetical protein